ncbi:fungal-specific transcription factor domain protein [Aspergillus steynii IBT 23096]|uniref:Fungal-specific transcription factor domain protein n=1 Tax=Aspergillus steynii IBT 23096 TaxID=1392250 RepID=A0A2I2GNZ3_9EURO|nr:fungal-specific transcription factor domain protein [Aspergillus steynii IBT 23096]PLB54583.1 fungal-specific transcription factor domain protein [Aspergillus steynii IBT 23096]
MFSTFVAHSPEHGSTTSTVSSTSIPARSKRHQVARACDWCRVHRIKCDSSLPCQNCRNRGGPCKKKSAAEIRTLPHAVREIERLRERVRELEEQVDNRAQSVANEDTYTSQSRSRPSGTKKGWDGIHTRTAHSSQTQWYGPSSAFYFIGRMSAYLSAVLDQPEDDDNMQPNSACRVFTSPTSAKSIPEELPAPSAIAEGPVGSETYLNAIEEDYFLNLFWQSYHPTYQILDEADFREHYKSLWADSATTRRPSALVDIMLALCMQYGVALTPDRKVDPLDGQVDINDASIAGRWYYRRSQTLLISELESPSIATLQCHIFSVVYLCNASFQNMAHTTLALAVRTAQILGLHLEPRESLPRPRRELRKRIWWTLYAVESKTCMKLGRPCSMPDMIATCSLPADDHELARLSVSNIAAYGDRVTWLTYSRLVTELVLAAQTVYRTFYDERAEMLAAKDGKSLYTDLSSLEALAEFLTPQLGCIRKWLQNVPDAMKTKRKDGEPFSTDRSVLDLERFAPSWLQRQRLLLELLYHNLSMNVYRPFICFPSPSGDSGPSTPVADAHAVSCVDHAIAITHILRQIMPATDFLKGWYEAFQWQWSATLSMVGFILAYPSHPTTPTARAAIDSAITVFEVFGNNFAVASSAANVTRGLAAKADFLAGRLCVGTATLTPPFSDQMEPFLGIGTETGSSLLADEPSAMFQSTLAGAMGLAYNVDSFYSFEPLYAGSRNLADAWNF